MKNREAVPSIVNFFTLSVVYGVHPHEIKPELFNYVTKVTILKRMGG